MELIVAIRSIHIGAAVFAAGAFMFQLLVWPRAAQDDAAVAALSRWLRVSAAWAMAAALLTWCAWLALIAGSMSAESPSPEVLETVLTQTNFGHVWILRFALGLLILLELLVRRSAPGNSALGALGTVVAPLFLASLAWAGHAVGSQPPVRALHLGADACHLLGAGLWLGTLLPLCFVLHRARADTAQAWLAAASAATRNFSTVGAVAVIAILVSGLANTVFQVGSVAALVDTGYGQLVSGKIALFIAILLIAVYNRTRLRPPASAGKLARLYRNAVVELLLGAGIVVLVGLLGNMAPTSGLHGAGMEHMSSAR
jgi:putative copper resistance protein D